MFRAMEDEHSTFNPQFWWVNKLTTCFDEHYGMMSLIHLWGSTNFRSRHLINGNTYLSPMKSISCLSCRYNTYIHSMSSLSGSRYKHYAPWYSLPCAFTHVRIYTISDLNIYVEYLNDTEHKLFTVVFMYIILILIGMNIYIAPFFKVTGLVLLSKISSYTLNLSVFIYIVFIAQIYDLKLWRQNMDDM